MRILMVTAEMAPFAKVGGLADVAAALSAALVPRGHDVRVVLPLYGHLDRQREKIRPLSKLPPLALRVGQRMHPVRYHVRGSGRGGVKIYLVEAESLFGREGVYSDPDGRGFSDALARAALHAQAALLLPRLLDWPVDVLHAHDAQAVPALLYRKLWYTEADLPGPAGTLLTIHNLAHQETHPPDQVQILGLPRSLAVYPGLLEFHGQLNLLKAGILSADRVNTVSPTYARETTSDPELGCSLDETLRGRKTHYSGILNGADYQVWNPARDAALPTSYGPKDLSGKQACRAALLRELGLAAQVDRPLCGFVGRLVHQKGFDLLLPLLARLARDGFAFAILGTGDPQLHDSLKKIQERFPDYVAFVDEFNEPLAHRIYAGCDLFLMPSLFEPCGLAQMYALRYGTPPVVRATGGLADTVTDVKGAKGTGFVFHQPRPEELLAAIRRAEGQWSDREAWRRLQKRGMACEFDWSAAAAGYEKLYRAVGRKG